MNKTMHSGRLIKTPELRYTNSGDPICNFRLAINWYDKESKETKAQFVPFTAFGKLAINLCTHKKKGDWIEVEGYIGMRRVEREDGSSNTYTNIIANSIVFGPSSPKNDGMNNPFPEEMEEALPGEEISFDDSELPF